jgi:arsenate reductase
MPRARGVLRRTAREVIRLARSIHSSWWIEKQGLPTEGLRSKSWQEFAAPDAPKLDFVITVCDNAAGEVCPVWPGQPMTAHWGIEDPVAAEGGEDALRHAVSMAALMLNRRIALFTSLPLDKLDALSLKHELSAIGRLGNTGE